MSDDVIRVTARARLGVELQDEQHRAVAAAVDGRDVLVVMPTGWGKSAVYQITGELRRGPTVVVSPLVALQHDQVGAIEASGLSDAVALNSLLGERAQQDILDQVAGGAVEFLFRAPEQLARVEVRDALRAAHLSLFVVDEAHCISSWGHDFRPDYLELGATVEALGRPPIIALTASASPPVRDEVIARLGLHDALVVAGGFDRPEIFLAVEEHHDEALRRARVFEAVDELASAGTGIVYLATRRAVDETAAELRARGRAVEAYHGTTPRRERARVHDAFLAGELECVVATSAFGLGIDKPDVRWVLHGEAPGSVGAYYQEIGRAARDGEPAHALMLYDERDLGRARYFASGRVGDATLAAVAGALDGTPRSTAAIATSSGVGRNRAARPLDLLQRAGGVTRDGRGRWRATGASPDAVLTRANDLDEQHRTIERTRVDLVRSYALTPACRRRLLGYFGQHHPGDCGACDRCIARASSPEDRSGASSEGAWPTGALVEHAQWGPGEVVTGDAARVTVRFESVGYRTLDVATVVETGVLSRPRPRSTAARSRARAAR